MATKLQIRFDEGDWALILGGHADVGLATARKLAESGMNLCLLPLGSPGAVTDSERAQLEELKKIGPRVLVIEEDAHSPKTRASTLAKLRTELGSQGKIRLLFQTVPSSFFRTLAEPKECRDSERAVEQLARKLGKGITQVQAAIDETYGRGHKVLASLFPEIQLKEQPLKEEELGDTLRAIGFNLVPWVQGVLMEGFFAKRAQVLALVNDRVERVQSGGSCAAIYAASAALVSLMRSMAVELAPYQVRANVLLPGAMDTPYARSFPQFRRLDAAVSRVHLESKITRPEEVADFVALLCTKEASWLNGASIHYNDAEHLYQTL